MPDNFSVEEELEVGISVEITGERVGDNSICVDCRTCTSWSVMGVGNLSSDKPVKFNAAMGTVDAFPPSIWLESCHVPWNALVGSGRAVHSAQSAPFQ